MAVVALQPSGRLPQQRAASGAPDQAAGPGQRLARQAGACFGRLPPPAVLPLVACTTF